MAKQATKGQKQIIKENADTLTWYRYMILGSFGIYFITGSILFVEFPVIDLVLLAFGGLVCILCYQFMTSMAKPELSKADGSILGAGSDLNMEGGIGEHVKDLVIVTCGCVACSTVSLYVWTLWLVVPLRAFYMLWRSVLSPWFFQRSDETPDEVKDKRQKKQERRMKYQS